VVHPTHVFEATSQIGFAAFAVQSALVGLTHSTHAPPGPQNGRALSRDAHAVPSPGRALSQARHVCMSQTGFSAGH
jgi:hypothetical protein